MPGSSDNAEDMRPSWRRSRARRTAARLIAAIGYPIVALLGRTFRWRVSGLEYWRRLEAAGDRPIMAFWHGRILPATCFFRDRGIVVMTSENFDGEWIARIITRFGFGTARGSSSRGAKRALVQLKHEVSRGHSAAFTVDGPRGPAYRAQPGAVWLAKVTAQPILPFHIEADRSWTLASWDATQIPKPFSRVAVVFAPPIHVPTDADDQQLNEKNQELERALHSLWRQASERARDAAASARSADERQPSPADRRTS
jgi:lysophospholipid acyltransferase (LPLAT)-like uncharacterized protein